MNSPSFRPPIGDLGEALSKDRDANDPVGPELEETISRLIITRIQHHFGTGYSDITAAVTESKGILTNSSLRDVIHYTDIVINRLVERGEITRVRSKCEGVDRIQFYPKDASFKIEPIAPIMVGPAPADPPLNNGDLQLAISLTCNLDHIAKHNPAIVLKVLRAFCHRCGALAEGHRCASQMIIKENL